MRRIEEATRERMQEKKKEGKGSRGTLITGSFDETMTELRKMIEAEKPPMVISVGDCVSENMLKHNILPHVLVVDNQVMREPVSPVQMEVDQTIRVKNPPKTLTDETISAMRQAIESEKRTRILVDGEEDLVTVVASRYAPIDSFVIYGQPREGIVVVKVTEQRQESMRRLMENMKQTS